MKKFKLNRIFLLAALFAAMTAAQAAPSFSGEVGGCAGIDADIALGGGDNDFRVPLTGFAAVQANLAEWCVARGEIALNATNFDFEDVFSSARAAIKLNELSVVLIRRAFTASSFFSAFLGSYEQIGSDAFLMRQFGIEPISSRLAKSAVNLTGMPILARRGGGLSYIVNFDKAPIATGAYVYVGKSKLTDWTKEKSDLAEALENYVRLKMAEEAGEDPDESSNDNPVWTLNVDARFSFVSNIATLDFLFGVGTPIQDRYNDSNVVLVIDTITMHGGINFLLGSKFTHSLLIQAGMKDVVVKGDGAGILKGDELTFLVEPRINFKKFKTNLTLFALDENNMGEFMYLPHPTGGALTFYKDDIELKNGFMTLGIHFIGGFDKLRVLDLRESGFDFNNVIVNAYATPFVDVPIGATARLEAMTQIGVKDITNDPSLNVKVTVSARKKF